MAPLSFSAIIIKMYDFAIASNNIACFLKYQHLDTQNTLILIIQPVLI